MGKAILFDVRYTALKGLRQEFIRAVQKAGIIEKSQAEQGNLRYEYSLSLANEDEVLLLEIWQRKEHQAAHTKAPHFAELTAIKQKYIAKTEICKYHIESVD